MKCVKMMACVAVLLLAGLVMTEAEEKLGLPVYDGAKYDEATSKAVSESMSVHAACYVTSDSVAKVTEFYKKQPGLEFMGGNDEGGMFKKGEVTLTIQNPWMDMKTGKMMNTTLISVVKY